MPLAAFASYPLIVRSLPLIAPVLPTAPFSVSEPVPWLMVPALLIPLVVETLTAVPGNVHVPELLTDNADRVSPLPPLTIP